MAHDPGRQERRELDLHAAFSEERSPLLDAIALPWHTVESVRDQALNANHGQQMRL
jgi:hypothetical protein